MTDMTDWIFSGSYDPTDVQLLLKPVKLAVTDPEVRERLIQSGAQHYSETLAPETMPSDVYFRLYQSLLARHAPRLGADVAHLAAALDRRAAPAREIVLASFVRAGLPIGVLLLRALRRLGRRASHYGVSIIRDRGVDARAMAWIAARHDPADVVFVDGWTGKGAIASELRACTTLQGADPFLTVVADPAGVADLAATGDDYAIPSGILNATVSGLVSRTILNEKVVGPGDFHACVWHGHLAAVDQSRAFIDTVEASSPPTGYRADWTLEGCQALAARSRDIIARVLKQSGTRDTNRIKPGIAEATRAVLRRLPEAILIRDPADEDVAHLVELARQTGVEILALSEDNPYRAITVIRTLGAD